MNRFRQDNTEGYTADELRALNTNYEARLMLMGINPSDPDTKSACDNIAERLLADFDTTKDR